MHNTYYYTYPFTNEPLNEIMPLLPVRNANVLTITASGDQTLFFHAYGAKHIDTVDFSIGALVITDIKIAAINASNASARMDFLVLPPADSSPLPKSIYTILNPPRPSVPGQKSHCECLR